MKAVRRVAVLVVLWLLAWGEVTVANLVSGIAAAVVLLVAFPPTRGGSSDVRVSSAGTARLAAYVATQLVRSNITMTRQILRPTAQATPGVLAHRLAHPTEEIITVMSSIIALSPGTMTVDVALDSSSIYVHFFHLDDPEAARRSIAHLERLAIGAIARGVRRPDARAATEEHP